MPVRVGLGPSFAQVLDGTPRPLVGMWVSSGSALVAEICAGSGLDWLLIDAEHSPNGLVSLLPQVQATKDVPVMVRPPSGDPVTIKQYLDLGIQNLLIPMVDSADQAAGLVRAVSYPPDGIRGVGGALARSSRWGRVGGYLEEARRTVSLYVQIESARAVRDVEEIIAVPGLDGIFVGPSDLAASMELLGQQDHPRVVAAVERCVAVARRQGVKVGVNAFDPVRARRYLDQGVDFILVGADVQVLAQGSDALAAAYLGEDR